MPYTNRFTNLKLYIFECSDSFHFAQVSFTITILHVPEVYSMDTNCFLSTAVMPGLVRHVCCHCPPLSLFRAKKITQENLTQVNLCEILIVTDCIVATRRIIPVFINGIGHKTQSFY